MRLALGVSENLQISLCAAAACPTTAAALLRTTAMVPTSAGKQAKVLNQIMVEVFEEEQDPLKELLGHTPAQVVAGSVLGILLMWWFL